MVERVFEKVLETLKERNKGYGAIQPIALLDDEEILGIIHMKFYRAKLSMDVNIKIDSLIDLIAYAALLLNRWMRE